jgi:hypothetical protein
LCHDLRGNELPACPSPRVIPPEERSHLMSSRVKQLIAMMTAASMLALLSASGTTAANAQTITSDFGSMRVSRVTGEAANGATFAGKFDPRRFVVRNGRLLAAGPVTGTLTRPSGRQVAVSQWTRFPVNLARSGVPVAAVSGVQATDAAAVEVQAVCDILRLVLGPLHLDILGLVVDLNRVVLTITAVSGAGNLLGNLLCAIAGLLDSTGISGLNQILANILNAVLGLLRQ